jgi:hypothetical protein
MTDITPLVPRQPDPSLAVPLAGGGKSDLAAENPKSFTLVAFYRGPHCPQCRKQPADLEAKLPEFEKRGISVVAISADNAERGGRTKPEGGPAQLAHRLRPGFAYRARLRSVDLDQPQQDLGRHQETSFFNESGLFLIRPDRRL